MARELDNKKMWAALYRGCNNNFIQKAILNELDAQGFKIDIYGEIVPIEPEHKSENYQPKYKEGDRLTNAKIEYYVISWDYNERNLPYYRLKMPIGVVFDWLCEEADKVLVPTIIELSKELHSHSESNELTEFEKCVDDIMQQHFPDYTIKDKEYAKSVANALLLIAEPEIRKQIASEIDVDEMCRHIMTSTGIASIGDYKRGVEDTIKAIEKGE